MIVASAVGGYKAVGKLYNALMTGLVLRLVSHNGADAAARFVEGHFRRQHLEKFLPGLKKLGLDELPDAVACAQYHFSPTHWGASKRSILPKAIPRHGCAIRRHDGFGRALQSAEFLRTSMPGCCMAGMDIMAFRSAIRD